MTNTTVGALEHAARPTAPLSPAASAALYRLALSFIRPLMEFASPSGATVSVQAVDDSSAPFRWTCTAGHDGGAYASLPFCRDDAKAHAAECKGMPPAQLSAAADPVVAEQHRVERLASSLRAGKSTVINGTPVTAVSLAVAEAITVFETASLHAVQLAARAESGGMSDMHADDLAHAEDLMAGARATLADAGMLHLIGGGA